MQVNYYTTSAPPVPGAVTGPGGSRQEGYGFVTFEECNVAEVVLTMGMHNVDGIEVMCSFSTERGSGTNSNNFTINSGKASTHFVKRVSRPFAAFQGNSRNLVGSRLDDQFSPQYEDSSNWNSQSFQTQTRPLNDVHQGDSMTSSTLQFNQY